MNVTYLKLLVGGRAGVTSVSGSVMLSENLVEMEWHYPGLRFVSVWGTLSLIP